MLDPKLFKENPQIIQDMLNSRNIDFYLKYLLKADRKQKKNIIKTNKFKKKKNQVTM